MAKRFFYVCAGLFLLAGAYAMGARNAVAQAPSNPVVGTFSADVCASGFASAVVTANGDVYGCAGGGQWVHHGNVFAGGPIPTKQESFGSVKARYR
ncbi:MAG: hypothetical protein HOP12_15390 [Candidatus Eisenbacteria bacterium]|uniref:Uncharacterized protein n=1 Tax=Eiseniibacteriota bacterium TaxID=2212470 RepID=A0A849SIE2_UNCEI|nr:hypothetical protein [Candidatus Eisenbacteria bacterium]